jgi:hypothetical protein
MVAWIILAASFPAVACVVCATFLAYQQRPEWKWFLGLSVPAGMAGFVILTMVRFITV